MAERQYKVFVGELSFKATDDDLRAPFEEYGTILSAFCAVHRDTKKHRGFGFVEFESEEIAQAAIEGMDGKEILGRPVKCNMARARGEFDGAAQYQADRRRQHREAGDPREPREPREPLGDEVVEHKVYVGRLCFKATEEQVREHFQPYGEIESVEVMVFADTKKPRGFAFVKFSTRDEALAAIEGTNGTEINGREIQCNMAQPKRSGGGGGGFGRGGPRY